MSDKIHDSFVCLHSHTSIGSMMDSMNNVDQMFKKAKEIGQPALAITDHGTMSAVFDARKASVKHGVKYIPGIEAYFVSDIKDKKEKRKHIVLLAKNEVGYRNLLSLNYQGYINNVFVAVQNKIYPRIDWKMLEKYNEGVICLTACGSGLVSRQMFLTDEDGIWAKDTCHSNVIETIKRLKSIFGDDLYLEIQPHNLKIYERERKTGEVKLNKNGEPIVVVDQNHINSVLINAAKQLNVKLAATVDAHYLTKEDAKAHDMLMAISSKAPLSDKLRHRYEVEEFYMKTRKDVEGHFTKYFNSELAKNVCDATIEIAQKCIEPKYLDNKGVRFPVFDIKSEKDYPEFLSWYKAQKYYNTIKEDHAFLRYRAIEAFQKQFKHLKGEERKIYIDRIKKEMEVLEMHNFCSYILVVADFINWAKRQDVLAVGAGRGSVAGSLVAYLLGIHSVNPIQYNLLFERFHNKEKKSYPDIDTDFHPDWREKVEKYVINKYGKDKVAHVSNLSTMTPKVIVKDIARSLELGGDKSAAFKIANSITDSIPTTARTIDEALRDSKEFRQACEKYPQLETYGRKLVGLEKAYATHAAGVVISDVDLSTYVPLRVDKDGTVAVQYEKNRCEENGLIKMDLLGLDHLRILSDAISNAKALGLDCPNTVPNLEDEKVWDEMCKGKTLCMFQLESDLMKDLCKRVKPRNIEDLAVINALNRPSLASWRTPYINRRHGLEKVSYKYKCLEKCFGKTLGICVFEEQLMGLAQDVAGWDLNKADGLRKLTKLKEKGGGLAEKLEEEFVKDAMKHSGLSKEEATDIWITVIFEFSKYGFNKSHSVAYSLNGYDTGWYKIYFTAPFMAAVLKSEADKGGPDRDSQLRACKAEAKRLGVKVVKPDINLSGKYYYATDTKTIMTGLESIKGIGTSAVNNILEAREKHKFKNFADFLLRTDSRYVRKDVIEALAKAGCFDSFGNTRKDIIELYQDVRKKANDYQKKNRDAGKAIYEVLNDFSYGKYTNEEYDLKTILEGEKETLGEYLSGNINDVYEGFFKGVGSKIAEVKNMSDKQFVLIEAVVVDCKTGKLKKGANAGKSFGKFTISDQNNGSIEMTLWPEFYLKFKEKLLPGKPIRAKCKVNDWNGNKSLVLEELIAVG